MSSENNEAIITFPIKFVVDSQNAEDIKKQADELSADAGEGIEGGEGGLEGITDEERQTLDALTKFVETTDKQGLQALAKFAKNPEAALEGRLLGLLGKAGIVGAIALAIIQSPEMIKAVVQALAVKGGPINQDYHRFFDDEQQLGLERNMQYRRAVGLDVIITSDNRGFLLEDPGFVGNNLVDAEETRALRTSTKSTKYGYVNGM